MAAAAAAAAPISNVDSRAAAAPIDATQVTQSQRTAISKPRKDSANPQASIGGLEEKRVEGRSPVGRKGRSKARRIIREVGLGRYLAAMMAGADQRYKTLRDHVNEIGQKICAIADGRNGIIDEGFIWDWIARRNWPASKPMEPFPGSELRGLYEQKQSRGLAQHLPTVNAASKVSRPSVKIKASGNTSPIEHDAFQFSAAWEERRLRDFWSDNGYARSRVDASVFDSDELYGVWKVVPRQLKRRIVRTASPVSDDESADPSYVEANGRGIESTGACRRSERQMMAAATARQRVADRLLKFP